MRLARAFIATMRPVIASRTMLVALAAFLAVDLALLALHVAYVLVTLLGIESAFRDDRFSISEERSYGEMFEYAKTAVAALALSGCWARTRQPVYAALAVLFLVVLLDNAFELHERAGSLLSARFGGTRALFDYAPQAFGELAYFGLAALAVGGLLLAALPRTAAEHRLAALAFLLLLGALAVFGVGVDLAHAAVNDRSRRLSALFGFIEDGGELVILSAVGALSLALFRHLREGRLRAPAGAGEADAPAAAVRSARRPAPPRRSGISGSRPG